LVETPLGDCLSSLVGEDFRVQLSFPKHLQRLALVVVVHTGQFYQCAVGSGLRRDSLFDEV
jgi:hypothetical protein